MSKLKIYVPRDAAALAVDAEKVAEAVLAEAKIREIEVELIRNGSRGMLWLEPMVEVEKDGVRHAFGPVTPHDVEALFDTDWGKHALALGPTEEIDWMKRQTRLTFARVGGSRRFINFSRSSAKTSPHFSPLG